jgi:RNA polymerase sigma-32 factor
MTAPRPRTPAAPSPAVALALAARAALAAGDRPKAERLWWRLALSARNIAVRLAHMYAGCLPYEDLVQEGLIGCYRAAVKYDPARGVGFPTLARWWARAQVHRSVERTGQAVSMSSWASETVRMADLVTTELERQGIRPTQALVIERMAGMPGCAPRHLAEALAARRGVMSTDAPIPGTDVPFGDTLPAPEQDPGQGMDDARQLAWLAVAVEALPEREREVIRRRYVEGETLSQVGVAIGLSRERVRQIERIALCRLRGDPIPTKATGYQKLDPGERASRALDSGEDPVRAAARLGFASASAMVDAALDWRRAARSAAA